MQSFFQDLKFGFRILAKHPGMAAIAVFAMALGLGLTTTVWSINYGAMLRGLPFDHGDEIVHLERARPSRGIESMGVPQSDFVEWRRAQGSFVELAAFSTGTINISGPEGRPERFEGAFLTANTLRLVRVSPILGRGFTDEEATPGGPSAVLLSWTVWKQRYGGDSAAVGRTVRANGTPAVIVGVMPRGFLFPENTEIWLPARLDPGAAPWGRGVFYEVMGRLRPGVSADQARRELETIAMRLGQEHPAENEGVVPIVQSFADEYIGDEPRLMLWTMMGAVFGVLLIACSNVANLLLARAAVRTKEVAIRTALGASRGRIIALMLTESLVLAATGAVFGTLIAWGGVRWFVGNLPPDLPFFVKIRLDAPILASVAALTGLAALIAGIVPALQTTRANLHDVLKDESRGASSLRLGKFSKGLVVAELALSCGLLVAAGFMIQSVVQFARNDYGVPTRNVFTARVGLFETTYPDSAGRRVFWRDLEQRLSALPGQRGVAFMQVLPGLNGWGMGLELEGTTYATERDYPSVRFVAVTPGYFRTFDLTALEGRLLTDGDELGTLPVAVVTRNFSARHLDGASPVGRRIRLGGQNTREPWVTIVGVIPDVWYTGDDGDPPVEVVIRPLAQGDWRFLSVAINAEGGGDPMSFAEPVRRAVTALDPDQPVYFVRTLQDAIRAEGWFYAVFGTLFAAFGVAALVLAIIGVYGVMSFAVSRRTQEVGVRMALGAGANNVLGLFLRQGAFQVGLGVVIGLGLAVLLAQGLKIVLFRVNTANLLMYAGVGLALALTGLVASWVPARRATRVDPMIALRYE